jgi:hypothetical protein
MKREGSQNQGKKRGFYDIPATIGVIAPLAPGVVNPMWAMENSVQELAKHIAGTLRLRKFKTISNGFELKKVEILEELEEDDIIT